MVLLAWVVHSAAGGSACCDLDDANGPVYLGGALPSTGGLNMFIAMGQGTDGGVVVTTLTPYHVLAVRGYVPPDRVNLSTLAPKMAPRAANATTPSTAAMACILACLRATT